MRIFSIYDTQTSRQARNLWESNLSDAVRPWFKDVDNKRVRDAIDALSVPGKRKAAARYLGLELECCA
ncbi:MAG: hypothetical protein Q4P06_00830 [Actinomycetaceae bacterium]|nr:hypothetical protein [Actinomycetaceae bacterium]